ncbi:hypothetical protein UF75_3394 [Desulfosporosinus sp. I2]|nr:hypothetical protein UF75_3394 [Desulfosporosinus sp. I2]
MVIHPWWELKGEVPQKDSVVIGQEVAKKFSLSINQPLILNGGKKH